MTQSAGPSSASTSGAYHRVRIDRVGGGAQAVQSDAPPPPSSARVRWWVVLPLSLLLSSAITVLTVFAINVSGGAILGATLIPVTAYGVLFGLVLGANPLLRVLSRGRAWLNARELMCVFAAMLVTAGIPGYGMAHQLVPIMAAPYNPDWNTAQRGWQEQLNPHLPAALFVQDEDAVRAFYQGVHTDADGTALRPPRDSASWWEHARHGWAVARAIEWDIWLPPLLAWCVFLAASYALFYSMVYIMLPAWSQREKLIFPLARIPEALLPGERGRLPAILRDKGFWLAFTAIFALLSYNAMVHSDLLAALNPVPLGMGRFDVRAVLADTPLEALTWSGGHVRSLMFLITPTVVGIAFLLPTEVSFSSWSYYLLGLGLILVMTWLGYGQTMADFPSEWYWHNNPVTALGAGALLVFAAVMLGRALTDYVRQPGRRTTWLTLKLGAPGAIGLLSLLVLWGWLSWIGLPVLWGGLFLALLVLIMTGLMRMVAESGVFWTQLHVSFFHLYRVFSLGRWLSAAAVIPMVPIYWVLYLDVKAFLGSNVLNAAKMEADTDASQKPEPSPGSGRRVFHVNLILSIALAVVLSLGLLLVLTHIKGGYQMQRWFFNSGPPSMLDQAVNIATSEPAFHMGTAIWYVIGGGYLLLTLQLRRSWFWWPHPIGLLMLCNPLMAPLWFSFFLGWVCKKLVVTYGGKSTFDKARGVFLGLILGELIAVLVWTLLGITTELTPHLTLNRHG